MDPVSTNLWNIYNKESLIIKHVVYIIIDTEVYPPPLYIEVKSLHTFSLLLYHFEGYVSLSNITKWEGCKVSTNLDTVSIFGSKKILKYKCTC